MSSSFPLGANCLCEPTEKVGLSGTIFGFIGETNCWGCSWTRSQLYLLVYTFFVCLFWKSNAQQKECLTVNLYNIFYNYGYTLIFSEISCTSFHSVQGLSFPCMGPLHVDVIGTQSVPSVRFVHPCSSKSLFLSREKSSITRKVWNVLFSVLDIG